MVPVIAAYCGHGRLHVSVAGWAWWLAGMVQALVGARGCGACTRNSVGVPCPSVNAR